MKKPSYSLPPLQWCSVTAAVLAALLQTAAAFLFQSPDSNYYTKGAILPILAVSLALLSILLGSIAAQRSKITADPELIFSRKASVLCPAVGFLAPAITLLFFREKRIALLCIPFLILAAIYSILVNLPKQRKHREITAIIGFSSVISCALLNTYLYFDMSVEMNAPIKTTLQAGLLCSMLLCVGELRFLVGSPQPRMFLMLCSWTLGACSLSAISIPLAFFANRFQRADYCSIAILNLFLWISALSYLLRCHRKPLTRQESKTESTDSERSSQ